MPGHGTGPKYGRGARRRNPIRGRGPEPWLGIPARRRAPRPRERILAGLTPGNEPPGQTRGARWFPGRHNPLPAGDTSVCLATFLPLTSPCWGQMKRASASPSRTPLSGGQSPGGASPLPDPGRPPSRLRMAAAHLPARGDWAWPARSRLPSGTQLPQGPGAAEFPKSDGSTRSLHGRDRTWDANFPEATARGGSGGGAAPRRARAKLQHKRPITGSAAAAGPGSSPSSRRSEPARAQPAAPAGRPQLSSRPRNARGGPRHTRAHPGAHAAAVGAGHRRTRGRPLLLNALQTSSRSL